MKKLTLVTWMAADALAGFAIYQFQKALADRIVELEKDLRDVTDRLEALEDEHQFFSGDIIVPNGDPEAIITEVDSVQHPGLFSGQVVFDIVADTDDGESFRLGRCTAGERSRINLGEYISMTRAHAKQVFIQRLSEIAEARIRPTGVLMTENEEILALFDEMRNEHIRGGWTPIFLENHEEAIS